MDDNEYKIKRRHRRFTVDLMDIQGSAVFASGALVHDISVTGISVITDRKLEIGTTYTLRIFDDKLDIPLPATVIRSVEKFEGCSPDGSSAAYLVGLQFHDMSQDSQVILEQFIKSHLFGKAHVDFHQMSGYRFNVRFHLDKDETALLDVPETYRVKKLSLGGMLIECSHPFEPETRFHMGITIPDNKNISFTGRVASCIPSEEHPDRFDIGIEFLHMPEEDRAQLKSFIKELYIKDAGF